MSFVIRRKSDGHYARGRTRYSAEFVANLDYARVYSEKGHAVNSLRNSMAPAKHRQMPAEDYAKMVSDLEIVPVRIVSEAYLKQCEGDEKDARFLMHLEAAGVDNWDGYGYAREAMREEDGEED